jgi:phosphatidylinositol alpha-mannosyltransferase
VIVLTLAPKLIGRRAGAPQRGALGGLVAWAARQLGEVGRGLAVFRNPRSAIHSSVLQLFGWALQVVACYALILAFGLQHRAGIATAAAILVAVNVSAVFPLTPSNVGVFQAACIAALAPVGIRAGTGLAYGLVLQAVEIGCATALGLPSLLREGLSPRELRDRTATQPPAEAAR